MLESGTFGSVRGVLSNEHPYRDSVLINSSTAAQESEILPGCRASAVAEAVDVLWVSTGFFVGVIDMAVVL